MFAVLNKYHPDMNYGGDDNNNENHEDEIGVQPLGLACLLDDAQKFSGTATTTYTSY